MAHSGAASICLDVRRCRHHVPTRPHSWPPNHITPFHTTTLTSHLPFVHTPAPHSYLCFGYRQPVPGMSLGLASAHAKDRATLHIHSNHSINTHKHPTSTSLGKVYKRAFVVPPSSPHSAHLWGVQRHRTGRRLIGIPFRSTLQTV